MHTHFSAATELLLRRRRNCRLALQLGPVGQELEGERDKLAAALERLAEVQRELAEAQRNLMAGQRQLAEQQGQLVAQVTARGGGYAAG